MVHPATTPLETVQCPVRHLPLSVAQVPAPQGDGIAIGTIDGYLSIYLVHAGTARFVHLAPEALDLVAGMLADAIGVLTRQQYPSLEAVQ